MSTVAVVMAAGAGERLAAGIPKAFVSLCGRLMVERAISGLRDSGVVDTIVVAVPPDRTDEATLILGGTATVVAGGAHRTESVRRALAAVGEVEHVLVHDAARPFVSDALITRAIAAGGTSGAAVPVIAVADTVKTVDATCCVTGTIDRAQLRMVQRPAGGSETPAH